MCANHAALQGLVGSDFHARNTALRMAWLLAAGGGGQLISVPCAKANPSPDSRSLTLGTICRQKRIASCARTCPSGRFRSAMGLA